MRKKGLALLLLAALLALQTGSALASVPYRTFTLGVDGNLVQTQAAYEPIRAMTRFGETTLKTQLTCAWARTATSISPTTATTASWSITQSGEYVKEIGNKKSLKSAQGVYVDEDLNVFVADEKARAVVVFDKDGNEIRTYKKPTNTPLFGESAAFKPNKIVLDKRGNLYIASTGNTNGIVQLSPVGDGEFLGYYDRYPRTTKVFLGEFAAHEPVQGSRRPGTLYAALCEAAYLTGIERNSDLVEMCCYAPLLCREGEVDWTPDLIWFNDEQVYGTPQLLRAADVFRSLRDGVRRQRNGRKPVSRGDAHGQRAANQNRQPVGHGVAAPPSPAWSPRPGIVRSGPHGGKSPCQFLRPPG